MREISRSEKWDNTAQRQECRQTHRNLQRKRCHPIYLAQPPPPRLAYHLLGHRGMATLPKEGPTTPAEICLHRVRLNKSSPTRLRTRHLLGHCPTLLAQKRTALYASPAALLAKAPRRKRNTFNPYRIHLCLLRFYPSKYPSHNA